MKKPINPTTHGLIDYAFSALLLAAPRLLKLKGLARVLSYAFGSGVTTYSTLSDNPVAVQRKIPLRIHKYIDEGNLAAMLVAPLIAGVLKQPRARYFFLGMVAAGLATLLLTDYEEKDAQ